jgi:hypothetical protein
MNITVNGKITKMMQVRKGVSQASGKEWMSQDVVIELEDNSVLCFNIFGEEKIKASGLQVGAIASVTLKLESTEWNGKWFTKLSCVSLIVQGVMRNDPNQYDAKTKANEGNNQGSKPSVGDLPF